MKPARQPWAPRFSKDEAEWMEVYDHVQRGLDQLGDQVERFTPKRKAGCVLALRTALDILVPPPPAPPAARVVKAPPQRKPLPPVYLVVPRLPQDAKERDLQTLLEAHRAALSEIAPAGLALAPLNIAMALIGGAA